MENLTQRFKIYFSLLLLNFFLSSSACLANEIIFNDQAYVGEGFDINCPLDHPKVIQDKIYIQPDSIYLSSNQIYVKIAEDLIPITCLSCDESGIFTSVQDIQMGRGRQETWICPNEVCGYENYDGIVYCGRCGTYRYAKANE